MANVPWYAIKCLTDQLDAKGGVEYPAGSVKSFGSVVTPGTDADYLLRGLKKILLGSFPEETGPDFRALQFNPVTGVLEPRPPDPPNTARALLNKANWTTKDQEEALRALLGTLAN